MPSFNPFANVRGTNSAALFEIRLERDVIVLRGAENEASSQMLRGVVVLCLPSSLKVDDVHLRMTGQSKIGWYEMRVGSTGSRHERTTEIFNHKWPPFVGGQGSGSSSKGVTLTGGNYEWPFELIIPGATVESVEGLLDSYITYKLKATVARGKLAYDLHAYKPVRIIRTLDPAALELAHAMTVENVWPNKIEYSLIIPQKAIIFGTNIKIELKFTSLLKGLKIGKVKCELVESQEFTLFESTVAEQRHKTTRDIANWEFDLNEEHYQDMMTESGQDGYVLNDALPLPKSLSKCLQDVETPGIKIRHKVRFNIQLHNPDGHTSELRATLPVTIFISPNMPIDESGNLLDQTPNSIQSDDIHSHAPPLYGEHILDQLYADIDPSGLRTPGPQSGMNTPFYDQSQSGSADNLASMDGIATNAVRPDALENRLHNLNHNSGNNRPQRGNSTTASGNNTPQLDESGPNGYFDPNLENIPRSNPRSRRTSGEDHPSPPAGAASGVQTPQHIDYSDIDLYKVPSYTTAVKTPVRGMSSQDLRSLPDYVTATSAPPSPVLADSYLSTSSTGRNNSYGGSNGTAFDGNNVTNGRSIMNGRGPFVNADSDATRRVHLLQARGRA